MASAIHPPDHLLSLDEWAAMREDDERHWELVEGVLQVSPRPGSDHQWALTELGHQLREQLPAEFVCLPEVEVVTSTRWPVTVRSPDLVVVPRKIAVTSPTRYQAADVLLAVEVVSPGSRERDHVTKPYEYALAGISDYWLLDLDERVTLTAYQLVDGVYKAASTSDTVVDVTEPAGMTIDVASLLPHRA